LFSTVALVSVTDRAKTDPSKVEGVANVGDCSASVGGDGGAVGVMLTDSCITETSGRQHALDEDVCGSGGVDPLILNLGNDWGQNLLAERPQKQAAGTN
jgi:hypothetical protein